MRTCPCAAGGWCRRGNPSARLQRRAGPQRRASFTAVACTDRRERRKQRRFPVKLRGLYVSASLTIECDITDLSMQGAFVRAELLDQPGTSCDVIVFVSTDGVVRLSGHPTGA